MSIIRKDNIGWLKGVIYSYRWEGSNKFTNGHIAEGCPIAQTSGCQLVWTKSYPAEGGAGLGLSICQHIAEVHNGRIEVESKFGEGSIFSIYLPLSEKS